MKIKNLLLLGFLTLGINAFAQDFVAGGVEYKKGTFDATKHTANVTVKAIYNNTNGKAVKSAKSLTIAKTVTATKDDETWTLTVKGFEAGWATAGLNVTDMTTLSVDITNFTNDGLYIADVSALTALTSLTVKGSQKKDLNTDDYTTTLTKLETLNLSELVATDDGATKYVVNLATQTAPATPKLKTVSLSADVETIADKTFDGQSALISVTTSATTIGKRAFRGTTGLKTIDLSSVADIQKSAFENSGLEEVTFGKELINISGDAFKGTKLTTLSLNKCAKLTDAGVSSTAFPADNAWKTIKLAGSKVTFGKLQSGATPTLDKKAQTSLKKITVSAYEPTTPAFGGFAGYTALTSVTFDAIYDEDNDIWYGVTAIDDDAFGTTKDSKGNDIYCSALTTIELPATIETIGDRAFLGSALTAITIPATVTSIGDDAFFECAALADLTFEAPAEDNTTLMTIGKRAFEATAVTKVKLPKNVRTLKVDAFKDCTALKSFSAENLKNINASFDGCTNLKTVTIPGSVQNIADNAFKGLEKLATVTFGHNSNDGDQLTYLGTSAFEGCVALTAIDLSATGLTDLSNSFVFKGCTALATVALPQNPWYMPVSDLGFGMFEGTAIEELDASMVQGTIYNVFNTSKKTPNTTLKTLKVGYAEILGNSFAYCTALETLETASPCIRSNAFEKCTSLATVTVNPTITYNSFYGKYSIEKNAFKDCSALATFTYIPENLDPSTFLQIDGQAFYGCTPYVLFETNKEFATGYKASFGGAPVNTTWGDDLVNTEIQTVQDKANPNQFVAKFWEPAYNATFDASKVKLYSVYMDGETAYFQACREDAGKYYVYAGDHVILKTAEATKVSWTVTDINDMGHDAVAFDDMVSLNHNGTRAELEPLFWWPKGLQPGEYIYRLTNTDDQGFGFTAYNGTSIKANQFFVASTKKPEGAAPLSIVWLDEDGNVENNATAIQKIQNADAENGAIYNLQGVRVQKAQKGLYIQNGKKYVVK